MFEFECLNIKYLIKHTTELIDSVTEMERLELAEVCLFGFVHYSKTVGVSSVKGKFAIFYFVCYFVMVSLLLFDQSSCLGVKDQFFEAIDVKVLFGLRRSGSSVEFSFLFLIL